MQILGKVLGTASVAGLGAYATSVYVEGKGKADDRLNQVKVKMSQTGTDLASKVRQYTQEVSPKSKPESPPTSV